MSVIENDPRYRYAAKRINEGFIACEPQAVAALLTLCRELGRALEDAAESLCELEVGARNASRAPSLGGIGDMDTVQAMFGRLAKSLEIQQDNIRDALQGPQLASREVLYSITPELWRIAALEGLLVRVTQDENGHLLGNGLRLDIGRALTVTGVPQ